MKLNATGGIAIGLLLIGALLLVVVPDWTGSSLPERSGVDSQPVADPMPQTVKADDEATYSPPDRVPAPEPAESLQDSTTDTTGEVPPLRSLQVRVVRATDASPVAEALVSLNRRPGQSRPLLSATTDMDGRVTFDNPPTGSVIVQLPHTPSLGLFDLDALDLTEVIVVRVLEGVTVDGRVTDDQDKPVAEARVMAYSLNMSPQLVATTDGEGRFALEDVHTNITLEAQHNEFGPSLVHPVKGQPGDDVSVNLRLSTSFRNITGSVLEPSGQPSALAQVVVVPRAAIGFLSAEVHSRAATTVADAEGRFAIKTRLHENEQLLAIAIPQDRDAFAPSSVIIPDHPKDATTLNIYLRAGAIVEGRVQSTQPLEPGAMAQAWTNEPEDAFAYVGNTTGLRVEMIDAEGRFRLTGLPAGLTRTYVTDAMGRRLGETEWTLGDGDIRDWVVNADEAQSVLICVSPVLPRDDSHDSEWRAMIYRMSAEESEYVATRRIYSSDGCAEFSNMRPEDDYEVRVGLLDVHQPTGRRLEINVATSGPMRVGETVHEIHIPSHQMPTSSILGRLVDVSGRPISGASLLLRRTAESATDDSSYARVKTATDGTFAIGPITSGAWRLRADDTKQHLVVISSLAIGQDYDCGDLVVQ